MFVLVTQADGSVRRISWITYAIVVGLIGFYLQQYAQRQAAIETAAQSRKQALAYLDENAYVEVGKRFASVIPIRYAAGRRAAFFKERRAQGYALMSEHLMRRGQREFNGLLEQGLADLQHLPRWKFGVRSGEMSGANWIRHVVVPTNQWALMLSVVMLLCLGIALEDAWGPIVFACLAVAGVLVTGFTSVLVDFVGAVGRPWIGASGLVATLMGAYFIRSSPLGGAPRAFGMIPMPSWLLLPIWLGIEYVAVLGVSSPVEIVSAPVIVHSVGLGLGAFASALMLLLQVENKSIDRERESISLVDNRVLERAMLAKEAGKVDQAFEMLRREHRRSPLDRDVALALWDVALALGKASRVVEAMLSVIEADLRTGSADQAILNWFAMTEEVANLTARPQLFVRIGEALLDAGRADEAVAAMARAVEGTKPLGTALAQRVVRIARDLDPELTRRAAEIALQDGRLGRVEREELSRLSGKLSPGTPGTPHAPNAKVELEESGEPQVFDTDVSALDPHEIRLDELPKDFEVGLDKSESTKHWNDSGQIEDLSDELDGAFEELDDEDLREAAQEAGLFADPVSAVNLSPSNPEPTVTQVSLATDAGDETTTVVNIVPARRKLKLRAAVPIALEQETLVIEVEGGNKTRLPYSRIEALAAAAIAGLGEHPVVLIDLIVNWQSASEPLKVIRLRSDRFDPRRLVEGQTVPLEAFRNLLLDLLRFSNAVPLPNFTAATGAPFQIFASVEEYNREILDAIASEA